ncbi:MAG TPA: hypothetical protein VJQ54_24930, partial [Candidatus Sulfotelmatobacter sp.]|nr:hypothetical protein [Candidatus Sulfotelmatobacter sp.]
MGPASPRPSCSIRENLPSGLDQRPIVSGTHPALKSTSRSQFYGFAGRLSLIDTDQWHKRNLGRHSFGHEIMRGHSLCMNIDNRTHIPWAQLRFEARFVFILFFSGVFGSEALDRKAVVRELAKI